MILLGASNLTIGWNSVVRMLQRGLSRPIRLYVALGMGRSYVNGSQFLARRLPGIRQCGLWDALTAENDPCCHAVRPLVLLTDVGNDLVYRHPPETIAESLEFCIGRLRQWNPAARIVISTLPLNSVHSLSPLRFWLARSVLFPGAQLSLSQVLEESVRLDQLIHRVADRHPICLVRPQDEWYGLDPIHIRRRCRDDAFRYLFQHWEEYGSVESDSEAAPVSPPLPSAAERQVFGRRRLTGQPNFQSPEMTVSAY